MRRNRQLERDMSALEEVLKALKAKSIQSIWGEELDEFKELWEQHLVKVKEQYEGSVLEAPVKKRGKK